MERRILHIVCQAHLDPVWLWPSSDGFAETLTTVQSAVDRCMETPQFTFTRSSGAAYQWIEQADPRLFADVRRLVAKGRWEPVGWFEQPDCNLPSTESIARQMLHAQRYFMRVFKRHARVGWNPDSFGHGAGLPQLLKRAGYDYYVIGRPTHDDAAWLPLLFRWRSADGSAVLVLRSDTGFGQPPSLTADDLERHVRSKVERFFPAGSRHGIVFVGIGNHGGALAKAHVERLLALQKDRALPELRFSTPSAFFTAIEESVSSKAIPEVEGELGFVMRGTYAACGDVKRLNREAERLLFSAEAACSAAQQHGAAAYPSARLGEAWERLLFNQFHDILAGTCTAETLDETRARFGHAIDSARDEAVRAVLSVARRVDTRKETGGVIHVFNPLPWPRRALVQLDTFIEPNGGPAITHLETKRGRGVAVQWMKADAVFGPHGVPWGKLTAVVDLPACGHRVFRTGHGRMKAADSPAASGGAAATAAPEGFLAGPIGLVALRDESDTWGYPVSGFSDELGRPELDEAAIVESGPLVSVMNQTYRWQASRIELKLIAVAGSEFMDIVVRANWQERRQVLKLEVPTQLVSGMVWCETPGGVVTRPQSGNEEHFVHWVALEGTHRGTRHTLGVMSDSTCAYDASGGRLRLTIARSAPFAEHPPWRVESQSVSAYLDQGVQVRRYRVLFAAGRIQGQHLARAAAEFLTPCIALLDSAHEGDIPWERSLLSIAPATVVATAVKQAEQGTGLVVRVQETAGRETRLRLEHAGRSFTATLGPWEIRTLRLGSGACGIRLASIPLVEP